MAEINLYTQKKTGFFSQERLLTISRVTAVVCVILVVSLSTLFFFLSRDPSIEQEKVRQAQTLASLNLLQSKTAKYLILIDRVNRIKQFAQSKKTVDQAMGVIAAQIPSGVSVTSFSLDKSAMNIALSSIDLSHMGEAVTNFSKLVAAKNVLKDLTIEGLVSDEKTGLYVLTLSGDIL